MGKGFGGMPGGNMQQLMRQAQKMQQDMQKAQKEAEGLVANATSGGGVVDVSVNGKNEIVSLKIDKSVVNADDVEMLEDLILSCVNEALRKVDSAQAESMGKFNIPGLM